MLKKYQKKNNLIKRGDRVDKYKSKYLNTALCMDEALLIPLENKEYEYITVKEIC